MKKRLFPAMATGFGCTVLIVLIIQFWMAQAGQAVVTPSFAARFENETAAALAQLGLVGLIGIAFAGAAQVFELERWSFLLQGLVHFLITAAVWAPVAWLCWTPMPGHAVWISIGGWTATYAINWLVQYFLWRRKVRALNRRIHKFRGEMDERD
ncbi:MAG: DUF3021 domain-containing protein [Clostridia bacterium]|nr:DUF3021 domain-containing protein [Clostridia bacterium]